MGGGRRGARGRGGRVRLRPARQPRASLQRPVRKLRAAGARADGDLRRVHGDGLCARVGPRGSRARQPRPGHGKPRTRAAGGVLRLLASGLRGLGCGSQPRGERRISGRAVPRHGASGDEVVGAHRPPGADVLDAATRLCHCAERQAGPRLRGDPGGRRCGGSGDPGISPSARRPAQRRRPGCGGESHAPARRIRAPCDLGGRRSRAVRGRGCARRAGGGPRRPGGDHAVRPWLDLGGASPCIRIRRSLPHSVERTTRRRGGLRALRRHPTGGVPDGPRPLPPRRCDTDPGRRRPVRDRALDRSGRRRRRRREARARAARRSRATRARPSVDDGAGRVQGGLRAHRRERVRHRRHRAATDETGRARAQPCLSGGLPARARERRTGPLVVLLPLRESDPAPRLRGARRANRDGTRRRGRDRGEARSAGSRRRLRHGRRRVPDVHEGDPHGAAALGTRGLGRARQREPPLGQVDRARDRRALPRRRLRRSARPGGRGRGERGARRADRDATQSSTTHSIVPGVPCAMGARPCWCARSTRGTTPRASSSSIATCGASSYPTKGVRHELDRDRVDHLLQAVHARAGATRVVGGGVRERRDRCRKGIPRAPRSRPARAGGDRSRHGGCSTASGSDACL